MRVRGGGVGKGMGSLPNVCLQAVGGQLHGEADDIITQHRACGDLVHPHRQDLDSVGTSTPQVHAQFLS